MNSRYSLLLLAVLPAVPLAPAARAQSPRLLADLNRTPVRNPGSQAGSFASLGGRTFFAASDPAHGRELWSTDGTPAGTSLLIDLLPGKASGMPTELTATGGLVFFELTGGGRRELWRTDGTVAGTVPAPGVPPITHQLLAVGNELWFAGADPEHGQELWRTDGTAAGTRVVELRPGSLSSLTTVVGSAGGFVYFTGRSTLLSGLYRVDIATGTVGLVDPRLAQVAEMAVAGSRLYFGAPGPELWRSDGTAAGTTLLQRWLPRSSEPPRHLTAVGSDLYTVLPSDATWPRDELWHVAGATGAVTLLANGSAYGPLAVLGNQVVFAHDDGLSGREPWITDGTTSGTRPLADLRTGSLGSRTSVIGRLGNEVLLAADDGLSGLELWRTDGTAAGTRIAVDLAAGAASSDPTDFHVDPAGRRLFFTADDLVHGREPHAYAGTAAPLLADIWPQPPGTLGSAPARFIDLFGITLFVADDGIAGRELWRTDGTFAGTRRVVDLVPGPAGSDPQDLCMLGDAVVFRTGAKLWRTDGTAAGTRLLLDLSTSPGSQGPWELTAVDRTLFFGADDGRSGPELWRSDGTPQGTTLVADAVPGAAGLLPRQLTAAGSTLFFVADSPQAGTELWRSDGTAAGTRQVVDLVPGSAGSNPAVLVAFGPGVCFRADTPATGEELFASDGTAAGTSLLLDIAPGPAGGRPEQLVAAGDARLFFSAQDDTAGRELWVSDGTTAGTHRVADLQPGTAWSSPSELAALGERVLFQATGAAGDREPWVSDGTAAGTRQLRDLLAGPRASSYPRGFRATGERFAWFAAEDGRGGDALWKTDGTPDGTVPVPSPIRQLGALHPAPAAGGLLLVADDGLGGAELWTLDPGAMRVPAGTGCGNGVLPPSLRSSDPVLGATLTLRGDRAPFITACAVVLGTQAPPQQLRGCPWHLGSGPIAALPAFVVRQPRWLATLTLPATPALSGQVFAAQAFFGPVPGAHVVEATNALHMRLGR